MVNDMKMDCMNLEQLSSTLSKGSKDHWCNCLGFRGNAQRFYVWKWGLEVLLFLLLPSCLYGRSLEALDCLLCGPFAFRNLHGYMYGCAYYLLVTTTLYVYNNNWIGLICSPPWLASYIVWKMAREGCHRGTYSYIRVKTHWRGQARWKDAIGCTSRTTPYDKGVS